mgnify:CR=1 FL=1
MVYVIQTALELGFMYALVAMALFLSYRILDIADLTTDSGFVLGAAVSVTVAAAGHPFLAILAAMAAGSCAGFVTAFLQTRLGVPSILAGIVTNTGLYTVNLMVMGWSSNVSLLKQSTLFTMMKETGIGGAWYKLILAAGITILAGLFLVWFLGTRIGLSIRATGDNADMVRASSIYYYHWPLHFQCTDRTVRRSGRTVSEIRRYQRWNRNCCDWSCMPDHW